MTLWPRCRSAAITLALASVLVLGAQSAQAIAALVSSTPTRYAALIHPPRVLQLHFSEAIVKKSSGVILTDVSGTPVRVTPVKAHGNSILKVKIDVRLNPGVYMVHWTAVSAVDGSKTAGSYQFTVP